MKCRSNAAFTLVELLVVVAIIALLASLLLPSLKRAREQGRRAVCISNLRQYTIGAHSYAQDWSGWFPYADTPRPMYVNPATYLAMGLTPNVSGCPDSYGRTAGLPWVPGGTFSPWVTDVFGTMTSYLRFAGWQSTWLGGTYSWPGAVNVPLLRVDDVAMPDATVIACDWNEMFPGFAYAPEPTAAANHSPRNLRYPGADPFNTGPWEGQNEVYADGHGSWAKSTELTNRVTQGDNTVYRAR